MQFSISLKSCFFLLVLSHWKKNKFKIAVKFHFENQKIYLNIQFLVYLTIYIAPQFFIWSVWYSALRIYFFIAPTRSQKPQLIVVLSSWGWKPLPGAYSDLDLSVNFNKCCLIFCYILPSRAMIMYERVQTISLNSLFCNWIIWIMK